MAAGNKVGHPLASVGLLTDIDTVKRNALGTRVWDDNGNEYIYLAGVASLAAGDWVQYNVATASSPFIAVRLPTTAAFGPCAVAMAAVILATNFGWFQIWGLTPTNTAIASAVTDGQALAAGSATGRVQAAVTTKNIFGAVAVGNAGSNTGTAFITYPYEFGSATI